MIIFNESIDLVVDDGFDSETCYVSDQAIIKVKPGKPLDAKIIREYEIRGDKFADIQFSDNGIAFGVNRDLIIEVP